MPWKSRSPQVPLANTRTRLNSLPGSNPGDDCYVALIGKPFDNEPRLSERDAVFSLFNRHVQIDPTVFGCASLP